MNTLNFSVFGYPVAQARARFTRAGLMYTPAKTKAWKMKIAEAAREAMADVQFPAALEGPVILHLEFTLPVPPSWTKGKQHKALMGQIFPTGTPDVDNLAKAVMDAINDLNKGEGGGIWRDDSQVVQLTVVKRYGPTGHVHVQIREHAI